MCVIKVYSFQNVHLEALCGGLDQTTLNCATVTPKKIETRLFGSFMCVIGIIVTLY